MSTTTALPAVGQAITATFRVATPEISTFDVVGAVGQFGSASGRENLYLSTTEGVDLSLTQVGGPNVGEPVWGLVGWDVA